VSFTFSNPDKLCFRRDLVNLLKEAKRGASIEFSINAGYLSLRKS